MAESNAEGRWSVFKGTMPDITPAQVAAVTGWIVAQLVAYGVLDVKYQTLALSIGATVLATAWKIVDAWLRGTRAQAIAASPDAAAAVRATGGAST